MSVKDAVRQTLETEETKFFSGAKLAEKLGVSRNAVWKAIHDLQDAGYPIESKKKVGYRLIHEADLLTEETVRHHMNCAELGHDLYIPRHVASTNDFAKRLYETGAPHGTVVVANGQSAGRGQPGKTFESPEGTGLYFSLLLREPLPTTDARMLSALAAVAVVEAIGTLYKDKVNVRIKWVNDILIGKKKICGILTEGALSLEAGVLPYAIIGIGINVRMTRETMPVELRPLITSLEEECSDLHVCRAELLAAILYHIEKLLPQLETRSFMREYRKMSSVIGTPVEVTVQGEKKPYIGTVVGINEECALIVRDRMGYESVVDGPMSTIRLLS